MPCLSLSYSYFVSFEQFPEQVHRLDKQRLCTFCNGSVWPLKKSSATRDTDYPYNPPYVSKDASCPHNEVLHYNGHPHEDTLQNGEEEAIVAACV
jgi:hypothetical protein